MRLTPDTMVGPYRILAPLGSGGMGEVFRARDTRLGREVALKILPADKVADPDRRHRFMLEAQAASQLNHPNITTIYDIGTDRGIEYIAMELVNGKPLDRVIPKQGLRVGEALKYATAIADALAQAHAAGIIHRDLKPANVMIGDDGTVKLLDFGIAKLMEARGTDACEATLTSSPRTAEGTIVGTAAYMSPEQAECKEIDARSDIFSFGALLYEMLTGCRAFQSGSTISTLSAVLKDDPRPIRESAADVPPELARVISRCLRKDRERRWQSMTDVRIALQELKEESDSGTLSSPVAPPLPVPRRARRLVAVGAGVVLLVGLVGAGAWWLGRGGVTEDAAPVAAPRPAADGPKTLTAPAIMTNDDIIALSRAGVSPTLIQNQMRSAPTAFDLSTPALIRLAQAGVASEIIEAMRKSGSTPSRSESKTEGLALREGQPLKLVPVDDLSVATIAAGSAIRLAVAENVVAFDRVVIRQGAPVVGTVIAVDKKKLFRKRQRITVDLGHVTAVDGQEIDLRATPAKKAGGVLQLAADPNRPATYDAYLDEAATVRLPAPGRPATARP